jgi:hypothetical protein
MLLRLNERGVAKPVTPTSLLEVLSALILNWGMLESVPFRRKEGSFLVIIE